MATASAPTLEDARRAAGAVVRAGAGRVFLFGSLARGGQGVGSDIDLVAVFDDVDYATRWKTRIELQQAASEAAGHSVEVLVTDRPEWRIQCEQVTTSFASAIEPDLTLIAESAVGGGAVDWNKEQVMATSDSEDATRRIGDVYDQLTSIAKRQRPDADEIERSSCDDRSGYEHSRSRRLVECCQAVHLAVESALKALGSLSGVDARLMHTHSVAQIMAALEPRHRGALSHIIEAERDEVESADMITMWRSRGSYAGLADGLTAAEIATPSFTSAMARIACGVSELANQAVRAAIGPTPCGANVDAEIALIRERADPLRGRCRRGDRADPGACWPRCCDSSTSTARSSGP